MFDRLNSLWIGEQLGYVERLTMVSALSVGHPFRLYSYSPDKLRGVPNGVEVRDANEVVPYPTLARYFDVGLAALGTDFFRYAMQAKGFGYWVDLDLYFIKANRLPRRLCFRLGAREVDRRRGPAASGGFRHGSRALRHSPDQLETPVLRTEENSRLLLAAAHGRRHPPGKLSLGHIWASDFDVSGEEVSCLETGQGTFGLLPDQASGRQITLRTV